MPIPQIFNEHKLMVLSSQGDERAFSILFRHYYKALAHVALKLTHSEVIAEEVVQDVFVKVWLKRETLSEVKQLEAFLYVMCRNETLNALKKIAAERNSSSKIQQHLQYQSEVDVLDNPSEAYRELITDAVNKLPPQQRKVYTLSRYDRLKYKEIGEMLGISEQTVKKTIQLAVKSIQSDLSSRIDIAILVILTTQIW